LFFATPVYAAETAGHGAGHAPLFTPFGLDFLAVSSVVTTMWGLMIVISAASYLATRTLEKIPNNRLQNFMEFLLESVMGFLTQITGDEKRTKKYFPLLGSFFILILASNYSGVLPGAGHVPGLQAPTSTLSVTAAFAIVVFFSTHYYGVKEKGLAYFKHFIEPIPFLLPLNIMEEFVKPLSLSLRLYGNVFGEEMVVAGLFSLLPLFLPIPMMILGLLFGLIQAFVFTLLATLYISTATAGHH